MIGDPLTVWRSCLNLRLDCGWIDCWELAVALIGVIGVMIDFSESASTATVDGRGIRIETG